MDGGEVGAGDAVVGGAVVDGAEFSSVEAGFVDVFYSGTHGILLGWSVIVEILVIGGSTDWSIETWEIS